MPVIPALWRGRRIASSRSACTTQRFVPGPMFTSTPRQLTTISCYCCSRKSITLSWHHTVGYAHSQAKHIKLKNRFKKKKTLSFTRSLGRVKCQSRQWEDIFHVPNWQRPKKRDWPTLARVQGSWHSLTFLVWLFMTRENSYSVLVRGNDTKHTYDSSMFWKNYEEYFMQARSLVTFHTLTSALPVPNSSVR